MVILSEMAECRESAQLLIALIHLPLLVFGLPYILWCVSCLRRVVAFWVKPGVLVVVANSDTNLRMCNNISNASLVHYNYWCAYYPNTCHGHSSIRITLDTRHGHTNLAFNTTYRAAKHKESKIRRQKFKQQFFACTTSLGNKNFFISELFRAFIHADIPISKLENKSLNDFLTKYTGQLIPDESTIRKNYITEIYQETLSSIRNIIQDGPIWISIDETVDIEGRHVGNVIVGKLSETFSKPFLLNCTQLEKCNHKTIAKLFNDSMSLLWPNGVKHENVLLFLTDAAPYMVKSAVAINVFYPKMIHLTCLAHGLHRIGETIRAKFYKVDKLIAEVKKIFLKAPSRVEKLNEMYPNLSLPPKPIITRWGTWLNAVKYYCENFEKIKDFVSTFDSTSAISIQKAKNLLNKDDFKNNLIYISVNFGFLENTIKLLETRKILGLIEVAEKCIEQVQGPLGVEVKEKMRSVFYKNPSLDCLKLIRDTHCEMNEVTLPTELTPFDITNMKFAPITSVEVERSFSRYKSILRPNRRSFNFENLRITLTIITTSENYMNLIA
ncbi:hypothetical protein AGLY_007352 [Aphis glycines]|uniref:DUF659 domain-containing protein n=1 Tax=Aphis glycines TaxID=307491 RepID=A0A6G0TNY6_APHGL|nr:hypothetical protein AGLY_007352 [Aphis glycines]